MIKPILEPVDESVSVEMLLELSARAANIFEQIRDAMLEPHPRKHPPTFSTAQIAALCNIDKARFQYLLKREDLPSGTSTGSGKSRVFTLEELITWVQKEGPYFKRPPDKRGRIITVGNFKGGVAKTTTAISLAQAMTLRGRSVLIIDCDPQGTATQLCGWAPDAEILESQTLLPLIYGKKQDLSYAAQKTYWHNLDLIPASTSLFDAEFEIPSKVVQDPNFHFWDIIRKGVMPLTQSYDVIVIDTPPALSYLTINAIIASDGVLMPCPPDALDFASSTQFWHLFSDIAKKLPGVLELKRFDFINIVLTKVKSDSISKAIRSWLQKAYGDHLLQIEIPHSSVPKSASAQLSTVYDLSKPDGSAEAYYRFKQPLDQLAEHVNDQITRTWQK